MNISFLRRLVLSPKNLCYASNLTCQHVQTRLIRRRHLSSEKRTIYCFITRRMAGLPQNTTTVYLPQSNEQCVAPIHSTVSNMNQDTSTVENLSKKEKLKRAFKDYGATVIIFHITISLMSLGTSYLIISSGVDVSSLLAKIGLDHNDLAAGASTFVVAYALHKVFAPVRISITLGATPFIVRYLRRIGILKPPKATGT